MIPSKLSSRIHRGNLRRPRPLAQTTDPAGAECSARHATTPLPSFIHRVALSGSPSQPSSIPALQHVRLAAAGMSSSAGGAGDRAKAFEESFEEGEVGRDEYDEPSYTPASYTSIIREETSSSFRRKMRYGAHPSTLFKSTEEVEAEAMPRRGKGGRLERKAGKSTMSQADEDDLPLKEMDKDAGRRNKGKSRFSLRDLKTDEPLYQKTFWEEIREKELHKVAKTRESLAARQLRRKEEKARHKDKADGRRLPAIDEGEGGEGDLFPSGGSMKGVPSWDKEDRAAQHSHSTRGKTTPGSALDLASLSQLEAETSSDASIYSAAAAKEEATHESNATTGPLQKPAAEAMDRLGERDDHGQLRMVRGSALIDDIGQEPSLSEKEEKAKIRAMLFGQGDTSPARHGDEADVTAPPTEVDAHSPAELVRAATKLPVETWMNMAPERLQVQQELVKARSVAAILTTVGGNIGHMDEVNVTTAVHRLGRYVTPYQRQTIVKDERFVELLVAAERMLVHLGPQGLVNLFWGLVKLEHAPKWLPSLMVQCTQHVPKFEGQHLSTALFCLSKLSFAIKEAMPLKEQLVEAVKYRYEEFKTPLDLTVVCSALAKLDVRDPHLFAQLSQKVQKGMDQFSMQEIAGVAHAFASMSYTDPSLFKKIRRSLERQVEQCTVRDVVQLTWAMSRVEEADEELFKFTISPTIRSFMLDLAARDLCTVAWAYANAGVSDPDLFSDLAASMLPKVKQFTAHDISSVAMALAQAEFAHKELFAGLKQQALKLVGTFSPLQLSRAVYGFGAAGVTDAKLYSALCDQILERKHVLYPENIVQTLVGLYEAEYLSHPVVPALLELTSKKVQSIFAEDCVQILHVLTKCPNNLRSPTLIDQLLTAIRQRIRTWWCFTAANVADLFEAMHELNITDDQLTNVILRQLAPLLRSGDPEDFLRIVGSLSYLPADDRLLVRTHIHRRPRVQKAISDNLAQLARLDSDLQSMIVLCYACARIGFEDDSVHKIVDTVQHLIETEGERPRPLMLCYLLWTLTEQSLKMDWVRPVVVHFLTQRYGTPEQKAAVGRAEYRGGNVHIQGEDDPFSGDVLKDGAKEAAEALLRLAWVCVVTSEEQYLTPLLEDIARGFGDELPKELMHAQQVALHALKLKPSGLDPPASDALVAFLEDVLACPRADLYVYEGGAKYRMDKRLRVKDYNYDKWLSETLIQLKVAHKTAHTLENIYRVSVAFPLEKHLIDVLNFQDLVAPSSRPLASAELRQRQLSLLGWAVHSVHLRDLFNAVKDRSLRSFLARIVSTFVPAAKEFIEFTPPVTHTNKLPSSTHTDDWKRLSDVASKRDAAAGSAGGGGGECDWHEDEDAEEMRERALAKKQQQKWRVKSAYSRAAGSTGGGTVRPRRAAAERGGVGLDDEYEHEDRDEGEGERGDRKDKARQEGDDESEDSRATLAT
ncbi:unnamed protein product [Vitrella brassicaformis CCMP3155]|uniref:RNA-editing substrate-binding complex 6 protein domain-containing protein n=2 Tax=Vitrella brassicaformis TaxID=1169539 RepID=A0A0G4EGP8_VITBC|nr:unnamed protein product [Vitrella brassicaformis CCMP3155]|eukprot:CEL94643.1 unnamed protein product [Vitrella brassicaformis CCMP3155]